MNKVIEGNFDPDETPGKRLIKIGTGVLFDVLETPKEHRKELGKRLFSDFVDAIEKKFK
jgi:hypothetical protein